MKVCYNIRMNDTNSNQKLVEKYKEDLEKLQNSKVGSYEEYKQNILPKINELSLEFDKSASDKFLFFYSIMEDEFGIIIGIRFPYQDNSCLLYGTISEKVAGRLMANLVPAKVGISKNYTPSIPTFFSGKQSKIINNTHLNDVIIEDLEYQDLNNYIEDLFELVTNRIEKVLEEGLNILNPVSTKTISEMANVKSAFKVIKLEMERIINFKNVGNGLKVEHQDDLDNAINHTEKLIIKKKLEKDLKKDNNSKNKTSKI